MAGTVALPGEADDTGGGIDVFGKELRDRLEALSLLTDRWRHRLGLGVDGHLGERTLVQLGLAAASVMFVELAIQAILFVPSGWGIEDFLGWIQTGPGGPAEALRRLWQQAGVISVAYSYLVVDTLLFVPVYSALFLRLGARLGAARMRYPAPEPPRGPNSLWRAVLQAPVVALVAVDLVENILGIYQLGAVPIAVSVSIVVLCLGLVLYWQLVHTIARSLNRFELAIGVALAFAALWLNGRFATACRPPPDVGDLTWLGGLACASHSSKFVLMRLAVMVLGLASIWWLFSQQRAELRAALGDMVIRSRYVLTALGLLAALVLGLDQAQDVLYGAAAAPWPMLGKQAADSNSFSYAGAGGLAVVFVLSGLSLWSFGFACWLWTRSVCQVRAPHIPRGPDPTSADVAAKLWARLLSLLPYVFMGGLCIRVIRDASTARYARLPDALDAADPYAWIIVLVVCFFVLTLAFSLIFVRTRLGQGEQRYYNCLDWSEWANKTDFTGGRPLMEGADSKFRLLKVITPFGLPFVALLGHLAVRAIDLLPGAPVLPSMALPAVVFALTLWLCFFGWLSMLEVVRAIPWVLVLILAIGGLGIVGLCNNHIIWPALYPALSTTDPPVGPMAGLRMLLFSSLLAAIALTIYGLAMRYVRKRVAGVPERATGKQAAGATVATLVAVAVTLASADHFASSRMPIDWQKPLPASAKQDQRPSVPEAMGRWLASLCAMPETLMCGTLTGPVPPHRVYFISSEGGGIRAAAWTAMLLARLSKVQPSMMAKVFSISGVSGGSVGAAVYRACGLGDPGPDALDACIARFAGTDLVSPLLSALMFEDALARVLPTSSCKTPGCGFLSRDAWFETRMEGAVPNLRLGLWNGRQLSSRHVPYLLLNSTWVETGERAIASDLRVQTRYFPGAKDQLSMAGYDLPLGTAAHNSARFPFVNSVGQLQATPQNCFSSDDPAAASGAASVPAAEWAKGRGDCGHLADGGYFDNGGGQSTIDVLNALVACLSASESGAQDPEFANCLALGDGKRAWLKRHLVPQVLFIRNGQVPDSEAFGCGSPAQPSARQVEPTGGPLSCDSSAGAYQPARSRCATHLGLFPDILGPALTLFNGAGTGAHGRLSEAAQYNAVIAARLALSGESSTTSAHLKGGDEPNPPDPVVTIDLLPDGIHYPLGWHLAPQAVLGMQAQSDRCMLKALKSR